ncbi:MAG: transposase [Rhodobacter sp.]|nr:transposase [Rhodobacter sp.]MCA3494462.1 transposase [Rhodobacter sp.]MCA3500683.1 transposase [Rhodobacter sp.]MCA3501738.1 transposase [Rhodobacter sp.]MCA3516130.1 transposase [Rhodobacter sp.]
MGKPLSVELCQRIVAFVEEGHSHRSAAARFRVSVKFASDMVLLKRRMGSLEPGSKGDGGGHGWRAGAAGWIESRINEKRDLTLDGPVAELRKALDIKVHRVTVWRHLRGLGLTHKNRPARRKAEAA